MKVLIPQASALINILKNRPHSNGCEIGVHTGTTAVSLLQNLPDIKQYNAIDPWESYIKYDGTIYKKPGHKKLKNWSDAMKHFFKITEPFKDKVITYRLQSIEAVENFFDETLDWIFIDANHEYEYIRENLEIWTPKVRKGGIVSGHDYGNKKFPGIKKAVDEFVEEKKLNIISDCYVWWFIK